MFVLAGCVGPVPPSAPETALVPPQMTFWRCREFTAPVMVEGQQQQAVGQTCQQPDGSWQVTLNTPGLPQQVYTLPPQAIYAYPDPESAYWWDPWFYGPLFVGGPVFLAHGFRHHHDFRHNGASHHGGSHKGGHRHGGFRGGRR
jgi:surface antigen